jgi:hypothetical protein
MIRRAVNEVHGDPAMIAALAAGYGKAFDTIVERLGRGVIVPATEAARLCRIHVAAELQAVGISGLSA